MTKRRYEKICIRICHGMHYNSNDNNDNGDNGTDDNNENDNSSNDKQW